MEPRTGSDRACAVAAAAAHDWNDELTVILSSVENLLQTAAQQDAARRALLLDLRGAAQRCAWKASELLNFTARGGARPSAAPMERLIG